MVSHSLMVIWDYPLLRCMSGFVHLEKEKAKSTKLLLTPKLVPRTIAEPRPKRMATKIRKPTSDPCPLQKVLQTRGQGQRQRQQPQGEPQVAPQGMGIVYLVLLGYIIIFKYQSNNTKWLFI